MLLLVSESKNLLGQGRKSDKEAAVALSREVRLACDSIWITLFRQQRTVQPVLSFLIGLHHGELLSSAPLKEIALNISWIHGATKVVLLWQGVLSRVAKRVVLTCFNEFQGNAVHKLYPEHHTLDQVWLLYHYDPVHPLEQSPRLANQIALATSKAES